MNKVKRIGKWEIAGLFTGAFGIILSITMLYFWETDNTRIQVQSVSFVLGLNLIASIIWLCGISLNEKQFLLIPIIYWTLLLIPWIIYLLLCAILVICTRSADSGINDLWSRKNYSIYGTVAMPITVLAVIFYIVALVCYDEIKKEIERKFPPLSIVHPKIPAENKELNA
ncbi:uncharacterized protein LOC116348067 [Contarinia nasturtii]|uniref:uncharacterized protein LOC116348067 n=1 Tax=Contarinia nasturtii TaxID=265458 RepID=UPI0012D3AE8D|nr:uncharacterized protein LOC116348067 [Contarinia nasturtii]XP_031634787.1 uncharacterized protein LOC116348067 [Contarinia nasturtii]